MGVMALFTISLTDAPIAAPRPRMRAMTLLEPVPTPVHIAAPVRMASRRAPAPLLRVFHPAVVPGAPAPSAPLVFAPALDIPRPLLPVVELRPVAAVAPPALKIDNLAGPVVVSQVGTPRAAVQLAGFTTAQPVEATTRGSRRTGGFASVATADDTARRRTQSPISRAGFGDAVMADAAIDPARSAVMPAARGATRPVEVLSKPRPVYSDEARRLQIEGEVLLEVLFSAGGQVHILRIVRGLGHGLDENAIAAAAAIRFRPAEQALVATDSTAIVHIVFQLAY